MHRLRHFLRDIHVKPDSGLGIFLTCVIIMLLAAAVAVALVALVSFALKLVGPALRDTDSDSDIDSNEYANQDSVEPGGSGGLVGSTGTATFDEHTTPVDQPAGRASVASG